MPRCTKQTDSPKRRQWVRTLLLLLLVPLTFNNISCTMFLIKEGYKEVKKIEEERKEKKEEQQRQNQWETQPYDSPSDAAPAEPQQRRHHGQWTPQREE